MLFQPLHYYSDPIHGWNRIGDVSIPFGYRLYPQTSNSQTQRSAVRNNEESLNIPQDTGLSNVRPQEESIHEEESNEKLFPATNKSPSKGLEKKGSIDPERVSDGYGREDTDPSYDNTPSSLATRQDANIYNSYHKFNPGQYEENSPEWQMAMLQYLLDMKNNGHNVQEISVDKVRNKILLQCIILKSGFIVLLRHILNIYSFP